MQSQDRPKQPPKVSIADIFYRSKELERRGEDIIHFDVGEPDFDPPSEVVAATAHAVKSGRGRYTGPGGIPEARKAIAEHLSSRYNVKIDPKQVLLTSGGRLALFLAFASLKKNSSVGIITPDWPAYRDLSDFFSFKTHFFKSALENSWDPNIGEIEESDCDCLILNYPNNPTGKILEPKLFDNLVNVAEKKGMRIISDEVYSDYIFSDTSNFRSVLELEDGDWIFATSLSKSYAMTGFRAGYIVSDEETISRMERVNGLVLTSAPEFVQYGVIAALGCKDYVREKVSLIKRRRQLACELMRNELRAEFYESDGSLYLFPKLHAKSARDIFDSEIFSLDLLDKEHVSVTPGTAFGDDYGEFVRLTLLQSEERMKEGIRRIARFLDR